MFLLASFMAWLGTIAITITVLTTHGHHAEKLSWIAISSAMTAFLLWLLAQ